MNPASGKSRVRKKPDFGELDLIQPLELIATVLDGLADGLLQVVPVEAKLPKPICREISGRWKDPEFHRDMRVQISAALSTVLRQKLPGPVADPIADALTNKIIYPVVRRFVEHLLQRFCRNEGAGQTGRTSPTGPTGQTSLLGAP